MAAAAAAAEDEFLLYGAAGGGDDGDDDCGAGVPFMGHGVGGGLHGGGGGIGDGASSILMMDMEAEDIEEKILREHDFIFGGGNSGSERQQECSTLHSVCPMVFQFGFQSLARFLVWERNSTCQQKLDEP